MRFFPVFLSVFPEGIALQTRHGLLKLRLREGEIEANGVREQEILAVLPEDTDLGSATPGYGTPKPIVSQTLIFAGILASFAMSWMALTKGTTKP